MRNLRLRNEADLDYKMCPFNFIEQRVYARSYYATLLFLFLIASEIANDGYPKFTLVTASIRLIPQKNGVFIPQVVGIYVRFRPSPPINTSIPMLYESVGAIEDQSAGLHDNW